MPTDITSRLAVLEERTKPKPRTIFDVIKDWSGILTFVIAVLYTYPLGVWDSLVVTAKEQRTKELSELRSVILAVTTADMEAVRAMQQSPILRCNLIDPCGQRSKRYALDARTDLFQKHYELLTGAELVMLGYYVNQRGDQGELASKMLTKSAEKMVASKNILAAADALRIKATFLRAVRLACEFPKGTSAIARINGSAACPSAEPQKSLQYAGAIAMDWTNIEAVAGDWACAEVLATWGYSPNISTATRHMQSSSKISSRRWLPQERIT